MPRNSIIRSRTAPHVQIFEILANASYEKFNKGQRLALSSVLFKYVSHLFDHLHLWFAWLELIASDSFSCLTLLDGLDADLRARHIRLIADVWFLFCCHRRRDADRNVCIHFTGFASRTCGC